MSTFICDSKSVDQLVIISTLYSSESPLCAKTAVTEDAVRIYLNYNMKYSKYILQVDF